MPGPPATTAVRINVPGTDGIGAGDHDTEGSISTSGAGRPERLRLISPPSLANT